jgi:hypothetical protein
LFLVVVVLVVGLESLQVVSLLGVLSLVLNTGMEGVVALRWRGGTIHGFPFVVLVLLQVERVGSLIVVTVVVFVEVSLVEGMFWIVLTPLLSKWLGTSFTLLVLTPVLSCLFEGSLSVWSFPRVRCFELIFLSLQALSVVSWLVLRVSCGSGI